MVEFDNNIIDKSSMSHLYTYVGCEVAIQKFGMNFETVNLHQIVLIHSKMN